jgi:hypothetical protein
MSCLFVRIYYPHPGHFREIHCMNLLYLKKKKHSHKIIMIRIWLNDVYIPLAASHLAQYHVYNSALKFLKNRSIILNMRSMSRNSFKYL